jgi:hypothetical protein
MSSLALAASPYNSGGGDPVRVKRQSTMRRPPRANPQPSTAQTEYSEYNRSSSSSSPSSSSSSILQDDSTSDSNGDNSSIADTLLPDSMQDMRASNDQKQSRIHDILNKMATTSNAGDYLENFTPLANPIFQQKSSAPQSPGLIAMASPASRIDDGNTGISRLPMSGGYLRQNNNNNNNNNNHPSYLANDTSVANLSNYTDSYSAQTKMVPINPSRPNNQHNNSSHSAKDSLARAAAPGLIDKINYMIHLLEAQQVEKTSNITEEFLLYSLLGVFVIFTVDSFSRSGTYKR